jgi:hypothetical protein
MPPWLGAIESLDLRFFVDRQHQCFIGWVEIEADDIAHLFGEVEATDEVAKSMHIHI